MKAAVTDLDNSRTQTPMDFWADGEKKSNAEDSETIPEEEVLNLEDPGVVDHLQVRAAAHGPRGYVCLAGDVSAVN